MQYWRKESPEIWQEFFSHEPATLNFDRHIPIKEPALRQWEQEIAQYHKNSYGDILKRDIKIARLCNERADEVLIG